MASSFDPTTFDYNTEAAKAARARQAAQALQGLSMGSNQGQFVQNGVGTFYAGGNNGITSIARLAAALLGNNAQSNADQEQQSLAHDSDAALAYHLDPQNSAAARAAKQAASASSGIDAGSSVTQGSNTDVAPEVQAETFPVRGPSPLNTMTELPSSTPPQKVAKAIAAKQTPGPMGSPMNPAAVPAMSQLGGLVDAISKYLPLFGSSGSSQATAPAPVPQSAMPAQAPIAPPRPIQAPVVTPAPSVGSTFQLVRPGDAQSPPAAPQASPPQAPAPQPATSSPQMPAEAQPTISQTIEQLQAIARTGPIGQQIAQGQLQQMFASKNGRFTTDVKPDPVNGGFVAVTTDTATGRITAALPISAVGSGKLVTGQTTDEKGNRLNIHKDGSTSPMVDGSGSPVVDSSVVERNNNQTIKVAQTHQQNQSAMAALDGQLANLDRMADLYKKTETGPVAGYLPNWTNNRQELAALSGANNFAAVREAVDGAGGGAQRFTQSELQHFANGNGGLSLETKPDVARNLIAQQRAILEAKREAIRTADGQLGQQSAPTPIPGRGQPVSAANYGFN